MHHHSTLSHEQYHLHSAIKLKQRFNVWRRKECYKKWKLLIGSLSPIAPVLKPDGTVTICGDFKVTLNQYLDVPDYPMPTSEELFTKIS